MDDFNIDMEDVDLGLEDEAPPEEASNRTFLLVAGIIGGILILSMICIAVYAMVFVPKTQSQRATQVAQINAQNTEVALASNLTAQARAWTATPTNTLPPSTPTPSQTPVIAPTNTPVSSRVVGDGSGVDPCCLVSTSLADGKSITFICKKNMRVAMKCCSIRPPAFVREVWFR